MFTFKRCVFLLMGIMAMSLFIPSYAETNFEEQNDTVKRGEYLSIAADCIACHTNFNSDNPKRFAGGVPFELPMGVIISSNITPSKTHGIGQYSFEDFKNALTKGKTPSRSLYPAMPYTEYHKIKERDLHALYRYFMTAVEPINEVSSQKTALNFPFSLPGLMPIWNMLFLSSGEYINNPKLSPDENRGKYLADNLAHCTMCHTSRNSLMGYNDSQYLAGGFTNGWYAPNITSDKKSGIGDWSEDQIVLYLREGKLPGISQSGGQMAEAVEHSFRYLEETDLVAIARYLKTVPPISTPTTKPSLNSTKKVDIATLELGIKKTSGNLGADIYQGACSTCHGISGKGSRDMTLPSLMGNRVFSYPNFNNIVLAISNGIERRGATSEGSMPAFGVDVGSISSYLNNQEIAAVSNYVINNFGNGEGELTEKDIELIRAGGAAPMLIILAPYLAVFIPILVIIVLGRAVIRRKRK